jgi:hypothetical protein
MTPDSFDELRKRRLRMENEIADAASAAVRSFRDDTGFTPDSIEVKMTEVALLSGKPHQWAVIGVYCHVRI